MRIVAVADTHTFESDLGAIPEGDVFVHAGDLCRAGTLEEWRPVAEWIRSLPHAHKVVVAGNHDWCFVRDRPAAEALLGSDVCYLQDEARVVGGLRVYGSPWQPAYNDWAFNLPRGAALRERWSLIPAGLDLLVTHGPPSGFGDRSPVAGRQGCADLLAEVERAAPRVHMFGHIHTDGGLWCSDRTCFVNVTTWECERAPTVLDVDAAGVRPVQVPSPSTR